MKKSILLLLFCPIIGTLHAQRCLDINIISLMGKLEVPGTAAASFKKCNTNKNDHSQTVIVNYGSDLDDLDTMLTRTQMDFTRASVGIASATMQMPSTQDAEAMKQLSERLKSMTPEQQKAWALQMAQEQQKGTAAAPMQDDAATSKLVFQTYDMAVNQMKKLNDEFAAKIAAVNEASTNEIKTLKRDDKSKCPTDKIGMPFCDCANQIEGKYWQQATVLQDRYNGQKAALLQSYLVRLKADAANVDGTVSKLKNGDALKSAQLKKMLFSTQSAGFANAFIVSASCVEAIRKDGSNSYVNKLNSDNKVYDLGCAVK